MILKVETQTQWIYVKITLNKECFTQFALGEQDKTPCSRRTGAPDWLLAPPCSGVPDLLSALTLKEVRRRRSCSAAWQSCGSRCFAISFVLVSFVFPFESGGSGGRVGFSWLCFLV